MSRLSCGCSGRNGPCNLLPGNAVRPKRQCGVARRTGDEGLVLVADRLIGNMRHIAGRPSEARMLLEHVLERYAAPKNQRHMILFHYDQHVLARAMLAQVLCLQGYVDQAKEQARISFEEAGTSDDGFSAAGLCNMPCVPSP
jgi:hypothetical protein